MITIRVGIGIEQVISVIRSTDPYLNPKASLNNQGRAGKSNSLTCLPGLVGSLNCKNRVAYKRAPFKPRGRVYTSMKCELDSLHPEPINIRDVQRNMWRRRV